MAQIIVYAGAVMVLFIFVIMLLNAGIGRTARPFVDGATARHPGAAGVLRRAGLLSAALVPRRAASSSSAISRAAPRRAVGYALFTDYLLPFEVTSVLILVAILGAIVLARKELD